MAVEAFASVSFPVWRIRASYVLANASLKRFQLFSKRAFAAQCKYRDRPAGMSSAVGMHR
jgi:hypothetical protein